MPEDKESWHSTACILCSLNCGIEVQTDAGRITRVRGDKRHPMSQGYLCQKAGRLDYYQNHAQRLERPLKRVNGELIPISWNQAIREIADKLAAIRDTHGGETIAYAGGGGQGNHLGGVYAGALRAALGTPYYYSALAQEKTGDFWVNGKLFGKQTCHLTEDIEHADYVLIIGTNPWQSHGFPRARKVLQDLARDPKRTLVVIDPRRTETAKMAGIHLALKPGSDALLLSAMLAVILSEGLENRAFLESHTEGFDEVRAAFAGIDVDAHARAAGVEPEVVRQVARGYARAERASVRVDLGLQQTLNSTLNSYLEKLLILATGHFGKQGCNNPHSFLFPLIGHSGGKTVRTQVTGVEEIGKLFPPNVLPAEIDSDHPRRTRALVVDSANPLRTYADTPALTRAFKKLDLLVVIDVALSETAEAADYVLPAASQYEKWEATFFNLTFPTNFFHLRAPLFAPRAETLPEPEIYRRLVVALGAIPDRFPVLAMAALTPLFKYALAATLKLKPRWIPYATVILHETLGKTLGAPAAAPLWFATERYAQRHAAAVRRIGVKSGWQLFRRILDGRSGVTISEHRYEDAFRFVAYPDRKVRLAIPELLRQIPELKATAPDPRYPFWLIAGDRRSYNAGAILRDPDWRKEDRDGALKMNPADGAALGVADGGQVALESATGKVTCQVRFTDEVPRGLVSMPTGYGMTYGEKVNGPPANRLTAATHCDPITRTPFHKNVPVSIQKGTAD